NRHVHGPLVHDRHHFWNSLVTRRHDVPNLPVMRENDLQDHHTILGPDYLFCRPPGHIPVRRLFHHFHHTHFLLHSRDHPHYFHRGPHRDYFPILHYYGNW